MMQKRRSAFTLVEVLIVVAIIVILVGLLVPTLGKARAFARRAGCQNNLRQILVATQQYAMNDPTNRLPFPNWNPTAVAGSTFDPGPVQSGWLYDYPNNGLTMDDMRTGALWKYIQNEDVYHCPLHQPPYVNGGTENITSYSMNGAVCSYGIITKPVWSLAMFKKPSEQILYFECDQVGPTTPGVPSAWNDGSSQPDQMTLTTRHGQQCCMGYFDFHADFYNLNELATDLTLSPGPLWCNPGSATGH